jgi:hypothetical protein
MLIAIYVFKRRVAMALALRIADRGWIAGLSAEVTLDGLQLVLSKAQVLHVSKCLSVFGAANVHHKRLVAASKYALQVKAIDKINL